MIINMSNPYFYIYDSEGKQLGAVQRYDTITKEIEQLDCYSVEEAKNIGHRVKLDENGNSIVKKFILEGSYAIDARTKERVN